MMDRPLPVPVNRSRARLKRYALTGAAVMAVVFGVGALPVVFLYFWMPSNEQAGFQINAGGAAQPEQLPRHNKDQALAFVDVNVVPMDREQIVIGQTVVVKDGKIVEMGAADKVKVPAGALRIDGRGKYLMPGLADLHIHLSDYNEQHNAVMLRLYVANGVTTILNLYGTPHHLELRAKIRSGELFGPEFYTSGPFISDAPTDTPTPDEVERGVVDQKRAGYDLIKIHGDFSREAYRRLFQVARREGIRVIGHAPRNLGVEPMLEERQDAVAHAEEYLDAYFFYKMDESIKSADREAQQRFIAEQEKRIPQLAQATAKAGTWVVANLEAYRNIALQVEDLDAALEREGVKYMIPDIAPHWMPERNTYKRRFNPGRAPRFRAQYRLLEKTVKGFRDAGVRLLAGTDALNPCVAPGFSLHDELRNLVAAGLTPYEALRTATVNAAEFLGAASGMVAVGKRADLILVNGDPLKDVSNASRRAGVMLRGQWLAEDELRQMLDKLR
ncbi:MAG: amidohydrolase family protein [Blastocatellia bacterium]